MGTEIERKFLVCDNTWQDQKIKSLSILQGYFPTNGFSLRVRVQDDQAFITLKKKISGISRHEFEYAIPPDDAKQMIEIFCTGSSIEKTRHLVDYNGFTWEIDEFHGENAGLTVAEIELDNEDQNFEKPPWAGEEVTLETKYLNASLAKNPFSRW